MRRQIWPRTNRLRLKLVVARSMKQIGQHERFLTSLDVGGVARRAVSGTRGCVGMRVAT